MNCHVCGASTKVINSRQVAGTVTRRRQCVSCGRRFTTREVTQAQMGVFHAARRLYDAVQAFTTAHEGMGT